MTYIALLDCNNFFVSCERLFRPDLKGRPVVVLSSNDGCVVARSQEIKDMGIPMGVPLFKVKDILKKHQTTVFSSHFSLYRDLSRRVFTVLKDTVPVVEQYSIDEAFFMLDGANVLAQAARIKSVVEHRVGIPVSIGIGPSKTIAKAANAVAKRNSGYFLYTKDAWRDVSSSVNLGEIWGVGSGRTRQFREHELETVADLVAADTARVQRLFGVEGVRLQAELSGVAAHRVTPAHPPQKSMMSSRSFKTGSTERAVVEDAVAYHVRRVTEDLRAMRGAARSVRVMIRPSRHGDFAFQGGSAEHVFTIPTNDTQAFLEAAMNLVDQLFKPGVPYQKTGVLVGEIMPAHAVSTSLFTAHESSRRDLLNGVIDTLNRRFGIDTVGLGCRFKEKAWQSSHVHKSTVSTTNWHDLPIVSANTKTSGHK